MLTTAAATSQSSAGSKYFDEARSSLKGGANDDAIASAEKGWAAVLAAGPIASGFLQGVYDASVTFSSLGRALRAEAIYTEAETLCAAHAAQLVTLRLQYMHANTLIRSSQYVRAEAILRASLEIENGAQQKSPLYVAILQCLAFVREQQGDLEGAETFHLTALPYPPPDLSGVVLPTWFWAKQRLPSVGEPHSSLASFYIAHDRSEEAEALYRQRLAQPSLSSGERLNVLQQLVFLLGAHGSKTEALAIQEQIVALRQAHPSTAPQQKEMFAIDRFNLANLLVDAGRGDEAKALLESELRQAEARHGKNSPEYRHALGYLLENRKHANDYTSAEKIARERLQRAEVSGDEAPGNTGGNELVSAIFSLADVLLAKGEVEQSESLRNRGIALNRAVPPSPAAARFEDAETLVQAGKPDEAVRVAQEISEGDHFGYIHLAQLMSIEYKAQAAQVASIALSAIGRARSPEDPRVVPKLTDWANFYGGILGEPARALELLARAEAIVHTCCGTSSPMMEAILHERAWLAAARGGDSAGEDAGIPYLEQLRTLRISIYGLHSRQVAEVDREIAEARARVNH